MSSIDHVDIEAELTSQIIAVAATGGDRLQIGARAERPSRSCEDGDPRSVVCVELEECVVERLRSGSVDGVPDIGPVDPDRRDRPVARHQYGIHSGRHSPSSNRVASAYRFRTSSPSAVGSDSRSGTSWRTASR